MDGIQSGSLSVEPQSPLPEQGATEEVPLRRVDGLELAALLQTHRSLSGLSFQDQTFAPVSRRERTISGIEWNHCRFDDSLFKRIEFTHCHFKNCSFEGATFKECEFIRCTFENTQLFRFRLIDSSLDPRMLYHAFDPSKDLREALNVFHQLARNARDSYQPDHFRLADSQYRRLQRFRIKQEWKSGRVSRWELSHQYARNLFHDLALGYGHSFVRYFIVSFLLFNGLIVFNIVVWDHLGIVYSGGLKDINPFFISLYFTSSIVTTLGFGDITPTTEFGFILTAIEALLGMIWMSIFVSLVFRRLFR